MQYRIEIVTELNDQIINDWKNLWERSENANIYNSVEWFITCKESKKVTKFELQLCYQNNKLVGVLPLETYTCFGITTRGSVCREFLVDTPFLLENYSSGLIKSFFGELFKKNVYLQKVDEKAARILKKSFTRAFFSLMSVNPTLKIVEDPFKYTSQSTMKRLRNIIKKYDGHIKYQFFDTNLDKHLETMFDIQEDSSKKARSMDIFENPNTKEYFKILTKRCKEFVRINILSVDGKPIAYEYGFLYKDIYFGSQISYHKEYKKYVPGKLIVYFMIDRLRNTQVKSLDQGGGISSYKMSFANDYRTLYNIYYSPSAVTMLWWKLINKTRRIKQRAFPKKNTRDHEFLFKPL